MAPTNQQPVERISAVTLVTRDMAAALAFYRVLGFELISGGAEAPFSTFRVGDGYLNLQVGPAYTGGTWGRIVFWVADVDAMHRRAVEAGLVPATSPEDATWGERYFHIHDPDGHELSFARPLA